MNNWIYVLALCVAFLGCSRSEKGNTKASYVPSKDDIFIDEPQADMVEGSAGFRESTNDDLDESSGQGPTDDEDSIGGSGGYPEEEGSGVQDINFMQRERTTTFTSTTTTSTTTSTLQPVTERKPDSDNTVPDEPSPPKTGPGKHPTPHDDNDMDNDVGTIMGQRADERPTSFFAQPGILAAVIGGAVVGLLCAILLVMFIVYRMRKKDEGSYPLDEPKRSPTVNSYTRNTKEFYA